MEKSSIIKSDCHNNLPAEVNTEIQLLSTSPVKYLEMLPVEKINSERPPTAIMLSQMKRGLDKNRQIMYISMLIKEVNDFFNVKGNMSAPQIKLTAELILDNPGFYDLTLGNIKACFRNKMMTAKLYDRLDGQIIIQWLREFKSEMAETVCDRSMGVQETENREIGKTYDEYINSLKERAEKGDAKAIESLKLQQEWMQKIKRTPTLEERRKKEIEFMKYKLQYLKSKQNDNEESNE